MANREIRVISGLHVEKRDATGSDEMALVGYATLFNNLSHNLGGFRETIKPGTFTRSLKEKADVRCLFNHAPDNILGRTKSGTLTISQDDRGLPFRCVLNPKSQAHRDLYAAVERGDISDCSFAFTVAVNGQQWAEGKDPDTGEDCLMRTLTDVDLLDVSAVCFPAYPNTSVDARNLFPDGTPVEVRSALDGMAAKRAAAALVEKGKAEVAQRAAEEQSLEEKISALNQALLAKWPNPEGDGDGDWDDVLYWVIETYSDYAIVCKSQPGPDGKQEYFKITYHIGDDGVAMLGDDLVPVEATWVPVREASKARLAEARHHLDGMIAAHKDAAAEAQAKADAESMAADAIQKKADQMKRCTDSMGDCDDPSCDCQNYMSDVDDVYDEEDEVQENSRLQGGQSPETKEERRKRHEANRTHDKYELRDGKVRTKKVGGKNLTKDKFAFVGDPQDTSTWKLPIHDAAHARNALARFNQTQGIPADKKAGVLRKIKAAAKKFGIEVSEENSRAMGEWLKDAPMDDVERKERMAQAQMFRS